jgi:ATP-dependent exoDNAse (exonuclease V) beta subunit
MHKIINDIASQKHATDAGMHMHDLLRQIKIDGTVQSGDADIVSRLLCLPELLPLFSSAAKTEVPVAGIVRGKFVSRRFDRMLIDGAGRCVHILDYKTDTDKNVYHDKYIAQLREYTELARQIYPGYKISDQILWSNDWTVESI